MENPCTKQRICAATLCLMLLVTANALAAAKAALSGPSQAVAGDLVTLNGQHFEAGATFTVITIRGSNSSEELVTAANDGSLSYQLVTASPGKYEVRVHDSENQLVVTSFVLVHPAGD
ncbi:MAG: hypothetical protein KKE30_14460 [Gammaproteobacteria bacterium]|nr:hypothetical protein [Gammaproteobacteria bacterium]MBU1553416.1 hypothetical protein [Gammaproteobacteria bacterium]MBU2070978.1 hypothetical protein [Gammaproteobacteria bacterium]MBU2183804.1 hypothetical protein [Gammaproteobacteria bacterium]MBU2206497.1 hypothetical protein [Gammaproteobacteria bacterium]